MIIFKLFINFLKIGLLSIGGGYAAIPLIESQIVNDLHWLTMDEFANLITIAEMTPGPIAVNAATFVGLRIASLHGAFSAVLGCIFPSCIIVPILAKIYYKYKGLSLLQNILKVIRAAITSLIAASGLSILSQVIFTQNEFSLQSIDYISLFSFIICFYLLRRKNKSPMFVIALSGIFVFCANFLI